MKFKKNINEDLIILRVEHSDDPIIPRLDRGIYKLQSLLFFIFLFFLYPSFGEAVAPIKLEHVDINIQNKASLKRGAQFFAANCMVCHTMKYVQYNPIAKAAGITLDKMPLKQKEWWLGIVPPDLTLIVSQRASDWVYTYLHTFYVDSDRPTGYNNLLMKNSNMTNILAPYQGQQELTKFGKKWINKTHYYIFRKPPYYRVIMLVKSGAMSPEQYDETMKDLVNFLAYVSEPNRAQREYVGYWVLLFILVLCVLAILLKKIYWKKVK